jgi:hypothetical protein
VAPEPFDWRAVLVQPPFVMPTKPVNIWTMSQRAGSVSYLVFGGGFATALFAIFVCACDYAPLRIPLDLLCVSQAPRETQTISAPLTLTISNRIRPGKHKSRAGSNRANSNPGNHRSTSRTHTDRSDTHNSDRTGNRSTVGTLSAGHSTLRYKRKVESNRSTLGGKPSLTHPKELAIQRTTRQVTRNVSYPTFLETSETSHSQS